MSLLKQIRKLTPNSRERQLYWTDSIDSAERIAGRVKELHLPAIKFVIALDLNETRPPDGHPKQAAYDILISALRDMVETLDAMPEIEVIAV